MDLSNTIHDLQAEKARIEQVLASNTIHDLQAEKERIEQALVSLENLRSCTFGVYSASSTGAKRRGRKSMDSEERLKVSKRMKKYWLSRRIGSGKEPTDK